MPRKPVVRSNLHYYHITARSNNKETFYLPIEEVWDITTKKLARIQREHDLKIGAFVLMSNHFHLLAQTPNLDIDRMMYFFMKDVTLKMQHRSGRVNKIFGGRYKASLVDHYRYLLNVYKYVYRNPVAAGLTEKAEAYPYSTLSSRGVPFKIEDFSFAFELSTRQVDILTWINTGFLSHESKSIKSGLRKTTFEFGRERSTSRIIEPLFN